MTMADGTTDTTPAATEDDVTTAIKILHPTRGAMLSLSAARGTMPAGAPRGCRMYAESITERQAERIREREQRTGNRWEAGS